MLKTSGAAARAMLPWLASWLHQSWAVSLPAHRRLYVPDDELLQTTGGVLWCVPPDLWTRAPAIIGLPAPSCGGTARVLAEQSWQDTAALHRLWASGEYGTDLASMNRLADVWMAALQAGGPPPAGLPFHPDWAAHPVLDSQFDPRVLSFRGLVYSAADKVKTSIAQPGVGLQGRDGGGHGLVFACFPAPMPLPASGACQPVSVCLGPAVGPPPSTTTTLTVWAFVRGFCFAVCGCVCGWSVVGLWLVCGWSVVGWGVGWGVGWLGFRRPE